VQTANQEIGVPGLGLHLILLQEFFSQKIEAAGFGELRAEPGQPCEPSLEIKVTLIALQRI
jgi:hypothetical protein